MFHIITFLVVGFTQIDPGQETRRFTPFEEIFYH